MITTGHLRHDGPGRIGHEECRTSEVINLEDENKSCDNLDRYELGVHGATGGVLNGKPIICGGSYHWQDSFQDYTGCYIFEENSWRNLTILKGELV